MPERRKRKSFANLSTVLNQVMTSIGLDKRLKEHTLMSMWQYVVGEPLSSLSRPVFFDHQRNLVVAVRDSSVAQELSLRRGKILAGLQSIARSLHVDVRGLRFDMKIYSKLSEPESEPSMKSAAPRREPTDSELAEVNLEEDIESLSDSALGDGEDFTARVASLYERCLRRRQWMIENGYPVCSSCNNPDTRLSGAAGLCSNCFLESITTASGGPKQEPRACYED